MRIAARLIYFATTVSLMALCSMLPAAAQETEEAAVQEQSSQLSFPREMTSDGGTVVVHTPQVDTWPEFKTIGGRSMQRRRR